MRASCLRAATGRRRSGMRRRSLTICTARSAYCNDDPALAVQRRLHATLRVAAPQEGYVAALVGQRPLEMGEKSIDTLLALHDGKPVQEIIYTGVDRVTKDNVGEFLK